MYKCGHKSKQRCSRIIPNCSQKDIGRHGLQVNFGIMEKMKNQVPLYKVSYVIRAQLDLRDTQKPL